MLYAQCVRLAKDVAYKLKPPSSQGTRSHPAKTRSYAPKALNETMLPIRKKKSLIISDTIQHRTPLIPIPISVKEKEWEREELKETHMGSNKK